MKKLLYIEFSHNSLFIIHFFKHYFEEINNDVETWHPLKPADRSQIQKMTFSFYFEGDEVDIWVKDLSYLKSNYSFISKNYDKVILISQRFFLDKNIKFFEHFSIPKSVKKVYLNIEESFQIKYDQKEFDEHSVKFISNSLNKENINYISNDDSKDFSYEVFKEKILLIPFLSFYHFWYFHALSFFDFSCIQNKKENLFGVYYTEGYKSQRDDIFSHIKTNIDKNNLLNNFKIYHSTIPSNIVDKMYSYHFNVWERNHITGFSDYQRSIVNFVFESEILSNIDNIFFTEKVLKALLFSNQNIIFIPVMSIGNYIKLKEMGYWFLNFDFFDFENVDKDNVDNNLKIMINSVTKSIDYISNLYKEHGENLENLNNYLKEVYGEKMKRNYELIINEFKNSIETEKIVNFILKD
jgi:hypothetical protein